MTLAVSKPPLHKRDLGVLRRQCALVPQVPTSYLFNVGFLLDYVNVQKARLVRPDRLQQMSGIDGDFEGIQNLKTTPRGYLQTSEVSVNCCHVHEAMETEEGEKTKAGMFAS